MSESSAFNRELSCDLNEAEPLSCQTDLPSDIKITFSLQQLSAEIPEKYILITDSGAASFWLAVFLKHANFPPLQMFILQQGEHEKCIANWQQVLDFCIQHQIQRDVTVVALGGGMVTDFAGFFASTYMRGLPLYLFPTTLLAQVDASIGGKNALNYSATKNVLGQFYHAKKVLVATETLSTLPSVELKNGLVECLKVALVSGQESFDAFKLWPDAVSQIDYKALINTAIEQKAAIVTQDEKDTGVRQLLNLGHTLGHAIEAASGFLCPHGVAVSLGISFSLHFSWSEGLISQDYFEEAQALFARWDLIYPLPIDASFNRWFPFVQKDKKNTEGALYWILPVGRGEARRYKVDAERLEYAIQKWLEYYSNGLCHR